MRVEIHLDCEAANYMAKKANQFGDPREFAAWIERIFPMFDAHVVGATGAVYIWDGYGAHTATAREEEKAPPAWSLEPGRTLLFKGRPMVSLYRQQVSPVEADELARKLVALLNKEGISL